MSQKRPGDIRPHEPMAVCDNGHTYPANAGLCPYDEDTPPASALDAKGQERVTREGDRANT